jgi:hypothetical protein
MNLRSFSVGILISALPMIAAAANGLALNRGDFLSAERITRNGKTVVSVKLSKSGKAKMRKLNETSVGQKVTTEFGGHSSTIILREPIRGGALEFGPFPAEEAGEIVAGINSGH